MKRDADRQRRRGGEMVTLDGGGGVELSARVMYLSQSPLLNCTYLFYWFGKGSDRNSKGIGCTARSAGRGEGRR